MLRIAGICICLLAAADANAQTPSPDLAAAAEKQAEVRITDDAGREFEGRLLRADDKIFTVKTQDGDVPFSFQHSKTARLRSLPKQPREYKSNLVTARFQFRY